MPVSRMWAPTAAALCVFVLAGAPVVAAEVPVAPPATPFTPHTWAAKYAGEVYREAWDYNLSDEDLFGGTLGARYRLRRDWSAGAEVLVIGVHQEPTPSTVLGGFATLLRWQRPRRRLSPFVEIGVGLSWANSTVPARGSRFNYLAQTGVGVTRGLGAGCWLEAELRWLHLSNAGLTEANPDIQALGPRIGIVVPF